MAARTYILAKLQAGLERKQVVAAVGSMESIPEVVFCEPVLGAFDVVATVETNRPPEEIVRLVQELEQVQEVLALKVTPLAARDRMWNDFESIPMAAGK